MEATTDVTRWAIPRMSAAIGSDIAPGPAGIAHTLEMLAKTVGMDGDVVVAMPLAIRALLRVGGILLGRRLTLGNVEVPTRIVGVSNISLVLRALSVLSISLRLCSSPLRLRNSLSHLSSIAHYNVKVKCRLRTLGYLLGDQTYQQSIPDLGVTFCTAHMQASCSVNPRSSAFADGTYVSRGALRIITNG